MIRFVIQTICLLAVTFLAGASDQKTGKIPNMAVIPGIIAGLALATGPQDAALKLLACLVLYLAGAAGMAGAGDIKLLMAVFCLYGILYGLLILIIAEVLFIIQALAADPEARRNMKNLLFWMFTRKRMQYGYQWGRYPFAMSVFLASIAAALIRGGVIF